MRFSPKSGPFPPVVEDLPYPPPPPPPPRRPTPPPAFPRRAAVARMAAGGPPRQAEPASGLGAVKGIGGSAQSDETIALRGIFLEESHDLREALGRDLVALERRPDDAETINWAVAQSE